MTDRDSFFPSDMPAPRASQDTADWWGAVQDGRLTVERCSDCGATRHPPAPICHACRSFARELADLPGTGTVWTFTRVHQAFVPSLAEELPYVPAVVALDESGGCRMVSNIVGCDPDEVEIGMPVELVWDELGDDLTLPRFRPRRTSPPGATDTTADEENR